MPPCKTRVRRQAAQRARHSDAKWSEGELNSFRGPGGFLQAMAILHVPKRFLDDQSRAVLRPLEDLPARRPVHYPGAIDAHRTVEGGRAVDLRRGHAARRLVTPTAAVLPTPDHQVATDVHRIVLAGGMLKSGKPMERSRIAKH